MIQSLLDQIPGAQLKDDEERTIQRKLATTLPEVTILSLIYQQTAYEGQAQGGRIQRHVDARTLGGPSGYPAVASGPISTEASLRSGESADRNKG